MEIVALVAGLLIGATAGYALERHHVRGLVHRLYAASSATSGEHRRRVIADYARRLHVRLRTVRHG
ncbi:hypothetical protein [Verrucosispora sp. NA02020]|uniref:hypothetical protein n=1 Tax=Verrucosispora sp. NA02020 TaxID=2742132 RepID=UPI003D752183